MQKYTQACGSAAAANHLIWKWSSDQHSDRAISSIEKRICCLCSDKMTRLPGGTPWGHTWLARLELCSIGVSLPDEFKSSTKHKGFSVLSETGNTYK